jgi:GR25 family glycosyltransferase involved in LPS biosynthesis
LIQTRNIGQIQVEHTIFGSNGHTEQPKSIVKGFTRRATDSPTRTPGLRKYFVSSAFEFSSLNLHHATFVNKDHEKNNFILLSEQYFVLNHYNCQSLNFWQTIKCTRGDADEYKIRDMELFNSLDQNDVEDTRLRDQNAPIDGASYQVFILSVKENASRREHVDRLKTQLQAMGAKVEIVDAFYWKTTDVMKILTEYGLTYTAENNYVSLSQVGCFLSHYFTWKSIALLDKTQHYIVLEDDMDLAEDVRFADLTSSLPKEYDMVYLWKHPEQIKSYEAHKVEGQAYSTFYSQWGTTAYMITPSTAQHLLKHFKTQDAPIDNMLIRDVWGTMKTFVMEKDWFTTGRFPSIVMGET